MHEKRFSAIDQNVVNIILINPPYFLPNLKREPLDADRRNARFFKTKNDFFRINEKNRQSFFRIEFYKLLSF